MIYIFFALIFNLILSLVVAENGKFKKVGYTNSLLVSILFSPIIGFLYVISSLPDEEAIKKHELENTVQETKAGVVNEPSTFEWKIFFVFFGILIFLLIATIVAVSSSKNYNSNNLTYHTPEYNFGFYKDENERDSSYTQAFNLVGNLDLYSDKYYADINELKMFLTSKTIETLGIETCDSIIRTKYFKSGSWNKHSIESGHYYAKIHDYENYKLYGTEFIDFSIFSVKKQNYNSGFFPMYCKSENDTLKMTLIDEEINEIKESLENKLLRLERTTISY